MLKYFNNKNINKKDQEKQIKQFLLDYPDYEVAKAHLNQKNEKILRLVLSHMPSTIVNFVIKHVGFSDTVQKSGILNKRTVLRARCFFIKELGDDFLINLDSAFNSESKNEKSFVMAHEIGHAYIQYKSGEKDNTEKNADAFAEKYGFKKTKKTKLNNLSIFIFGIMFLLGFLIRFYSSRGG